MSRPIILAKSALNHDQLTVKKNIGCDGIEIQLLSELIGDRSKGEYLDPSLVFDLSSFEDYTISAVHAPLLSDEDDITLEVLCDNKDMNLLHHVFYIANYFGTLQKKRVIVVLHSETYYDKLADLGDAWHRLALSIKSMLDYYPYTEVAIENVSPLRGIGKGKELHLANNFAFDNIRMVQLLRDKLGTDRVGTCLDTCHAMLADKYITALYNLAGDVPGPDLSLDKYFRMNKPFAKLIHLCDIKGSGYGKGRHGVPFHAGTYDKLSKILDLYNTYEYSCPITLEDEESDFHVCDGYKNTKEQLDIYYNKKLPCSKTALKWCRDNAPDAFKSYSDIDLWNAMEPAYRHFHP